MQHSLFEPLYSFHAHTMEKCQLAPFTQTAPSLFTISSPSPSSPLHAIENSPSCFDQDISSSSLLHAHILSPSSYKKARCEQDLTSDFTHVNLPPPHSSSSSPLSIHSNSSHSKLPLSHPITFFATSAPPTVRSHSDADDCKFDDDGSVASKLLSSITKSISSPSLQLASCKESARETPYQKALKLKQMKLQHCAEALGMESSDNSSFLCDSQHIYQDKIGMLGNAYSFPPSFTLPNSQPESSLKSVRSSPNLSSASTNHSRYTRSTSFPPPLSHTLPTSSSSDSLSLSLRAYREDGRFILKETMVPCKHYFHANRRNGRLTLHVVTREEEAEAEEDSARQDDQEEFSYRKSKGENLAQVEDEVCVKKSIGTHRSEEINVAGSHLDMSPHRLKCIAHHHSQIINEHSEEDDKSNVMSNVITLSLKTSSHSKVTLHKAQVLSYPLVSSPLQQSALIHSSKRNHGFLSSNHDISTFPQSRQNIIWESNLMPCVASSRKHLRSSNAAGGGGGFGGGGAVVPAFVMEEMRAKSLMKAVSELATSLVLEASYGKYNGDWWLAGDQKKPLLSTAEERGTIIRGYAASAIDNDIMNVKDGLISHGAIDNDIMNGKDGLISHGAKFGYNTSYMLKEEEQASEGGKELNISTSPLNVDLQFSSCNDNLQCELEWLHTLHCKELFDRHHLGHGLTKLPCIPTRS